jgi:hypothetical protein
MKGGHRGRQRHTCLEDSCQIENRRRRFPRLSRPLLVYAEGHLLEANYPLEPRDFHNDVRPGGEKRTGELKESEGLAPT